MQNERSNWLRHCALPSSVGTLPRSPTGSWLFYPEGATRRNSPRALADGNSPSAGDRSTGAPVAVEPPDGPLRPPDGPEGPSICPRPAVDAADLMTAICHRTERR